jgi:copper(I)-binding protein
MPLEESIMLPLIRGASVVAAILLAVASLSPSSDAHAQGSMQHTASAPTFRVGHLVITAPWSRATPKGAPVAGGYLSITNNGTEPDRLIGGSFPGAGKVQVHEMTMSNGVMRMRPVVGGLEIKPGQTVMLKPGGYHLMFMRFKGQLKAGETVTGTLTFQKAGSVTVTYQVVSMGAPGPAGGMHMDHMKMQH